MKSGNEIVKLKTDKEKWKDAKEHIWMLRFSIAKYYLENHGEEEFLNFIRADHNLTEKVKLGGVKKTIVDGLSKLSKPFLMKEFLKQGIDGFQFEIPPKNYIIEEMPNSFRMEITKCPIRNQFNKWAKKYSPELKDKICNWDILAGEKSLEYGIEQTIELTEKGCIFHFNILKK